MKKTVKRIFALFMSLLLLPSAFAGVTSFAVEETSEVPPIIELDLEKDFVPGQLMIVLREPYLGNNLAEVLPEISIASYYDIYGDVIEELGEENVTDVMLDGMGTMFTVTLTEETEEAVTDALDKLSDNTNLLSASPNYLSEDCATTPNDPSYSTEQWALPKIKAPEVWDDITDSTVKIAVLDSGFCTDHPDLENILNTDLAYNAFSASLNDIEDEQNGHGTHVAGIIAAEGNNNRGVCGVAWDAEVVPIRISGSDNGDASNAAEVRGLLYALALDIKVVNLSYGVRFSYPLMYAFQAFGINGGLVVIAAGNGDIDPEKDGIGDDLSSVYNYVTTSANSSVILVGASDQNDNPASFSNYSGTVVDIFAPGVDIYSTIPRLDYDNWLYKNNSGTSMAAPFVTGAVALLMSKYPNLSAQTIKNAIIENADYVPALAGKCVANGRLNIKAAMDALEDAETEYTYPAGYNITVSPSITNGVVTPSRTLAQSNMFVSLTVDPNPGYWLKPNTLAYNGTVIDQGIYSGYVYNNELEEYVYSETGESPESDGDGILYPNCWYFRMPSSAVIITAAFYMIGDVDLDGSVTVSDSLAVLRHVSGAEVLAGDALIAADVDGDGEVTQTDSQIILSYVAGEITVFPIEA